MVGVGYTSPGNQTDPDQTMIPVLTHARKIQLLALVNHVIAIAGIWYAISTSNYYLLLTAAVATVFITIVSVNIALHRFISHNSFKTGYWRSKFLIYISIISAFGSPVSWAAMHRYHHAKSGSVDDNQSPKNIGYLRAWFTLYSSVTIPTTMIRDVIKNSDYMLIHRHYFKLLAGYLVILYLINPVLPVFLFCLPAALCYQAAGAFAVIPHTSRFGYKVLPSLRDDDAVNSPLASVLSLGEGWHNYHHSRPGDHRQGHGKWELDPPAWVIEKFFKI